MWRRMPPQMVAGLQMQKLRQKQKQKQSQRPRLLHGWLEKAAAAAKILILDMVAMFSKNTPHSFKLCTQSSLYSEVLPPQQQASRFCRHARWRHDPKQADARPHYLASLFRHTRMGLTWLLECCHVARSATLCEPLLYVSSFSARGGLHVPQEGRQEVRGAVARLHYHLLCLLRVLVGWPVACCGPSH